MHEDSPPPFIVIRNPAPPPKRDVYERSLELVEHVQKLVENAQARFHLRDRLDRSLTALVFELSRAKDAVKSERWRHYRRAQTLARDCSTILDILRHQKAATEADLAAAGDVLHELLQDLGSLG